MPIRSPLGNMRNMSIISIKCSHSLAVLGTWIDCFLTSSLSIILVSSCDMQWPEDQCSKENPLPMTLNGEELKHVDHFKYLGSVIDKDGTIDKDVDLRVQAAWSSWRKLTGILYDRKIPLRLKAKVYEAII